MGWYQQFLKRFGFAGLLLTVLMLSYVVMLVVMPILGPEGFAQFWGKVTVPADFPTLLQQPWSLATYWMASHPTAFLFVVMDLVVLYGFGQILNAMVGDRRTQGIFLLGLLLNATLALGLVFLLPTVDPSADARLSGFGAINATLIAATITLVPRYNFRLIYWDVPLLVIGLFVLLGSIVSHGAVFAMEGVAEIVGAVVGFVTIKAMRSGWDLSNFFRGAANRPAQPLPRKPEPVMSSQRPVVRNVHTKQQQAQAKQPPMSEQEELDLLLDRINEVGVDGLTSSEKKRLDELSGK